MARNGTGRTAAGVTLLEMMVVLAIASVLAAIVFPAVGTGLNALELRSAATRLAGAARYARDQAVYRQRIYQLRVSGDRRSVSVSDWEGREERTYELPAAVEVLAVGPDAWGEAHRDRRIFFFPDGSAPAFEVVLAGARRQITVAGDPLTGAAKVEER
ncbi:MAG TPA: GspH/FimT family pseudopilin [Terriglobia bacterium]|nr:GspH/FimT family pseudopilin [Terriglobia bacterium]